MTVEEIFEKIIHHQIKGLMIHEQFASYYDFLGLKGSRKCHEYHYLDESIGFRATMHYMISHYNKLVPDTPIDAPKMIPENWYNYTRDDVDINTKRNAIKQAMESWKEWETSTKKLYEDMYMELLRLDDVAGALFIKNLICDVTHELKKVQQYCLNLKAVDYDMVYIIEKQDEIHHKFKCKISELFK